MKNDMDIRELYRPNIRSLAPYSTARDEYRASWSWPCASSWS